MALITLSRGTYTGARWLGERLAEELGYRTVSRGQLYAHVQERYGVSRDDVAAVMEQAPTMAGYAQSRGLTESLAEKRERIFWLLQASLCELLQGDEAIYHGQAGHLLLPDITHVLRIRIVAPRPMRLLMCVERGGGDELEASRRIDQVDAERSRWTRMLFGVDWSDPGIFDMVLNLETMDIAQMGELVATAVQLNAFTPTEQSRSKMRDLCIRSRLMARLLTEQAPGLAGVRLDVVDGELAVHSRLPDQELSLVRDYAASCAADCAV